MRRTFAVLSVAFLALAPLACRSGPLAGAFATASPHEKYADSLRDAGLAQTALGFEWLRAGREALARPIPVSLPFRETGYFAPERPAAAAYRFDLARGQRLIVDLTWQSSEKPARLFLDLFEAADPEESPRRVASFEPDVPRLTFDAGRGGAYLLRLQPEMLRGGRYTVTQRAAASLSFPVKGQDSRALQSGFGDPRDGGGRAHEGVDIFAPRGTPALAAAAAVVSSVTTNALGGNVVWLWEPERNLSLYYAHLDEQTVSAGQRVAAGDTVGLIGNTGNARGGSPHLHFAVYKRGEGPLDPYPFVHEPPEKPREVAAVRGARRRVSPRSAELRFSPEPEADVIRELPRYTLLSVVGASKDFFRVRLPDGAEGFVPARATESVEKSVRQIGGSEPRTLRDRPGPAAAEIVTVAGGTSLPVLARFEGFLFVRAPGGRDGWVEAESPAGR